MCFIIVLFITVFKEHLFCMYWMQQTTNTINKSSLIREPQAGIYIFHQPVGFVKLDSQLFFPQAMRWGWLSGTGHKLLQSALKSMQKQTSLHGSFSSSHPNPNPHPQLLCVAWLHINSQSKFGKWWHSTVRCHHQVYS